MGTSPHFCSPDPEQCLIMVSSTCSSSIYLCCSMCKYASLQDKGRRKRVRSKLKTKARRRKVMTGKSKEAWASVGHWPTNCYSLSTHQTHRAKTKKAGPENYFRRERMTRWALQHVQQICDKTVEIQVWGNIRSQSLSHTPPAVVLGIFCLPA